MLVSQGLQAPQAGVSRGLGNLGQAPGKARQSMPVKGCSVAAGGAPAHSIVDSPVGVFSVMVYARTTKLLRETTLDGFALKMRLAPGPLKVAGRLCSEDATASILPKSTQAQHWR